ncbi:MAG: hypothetical protein HDT15_00265 [Oscillibacter sp.]|nr:hypothetical protein [Oscillibacter sp.]
MDYYNSLIGHTPFSFFRSINKPIVIFNYYENYVAKLLNDLCTARGIDFECSVEYFQDSSVEAMCSCNGKENKLIIFEGALLSIYRFASILSCVYRTVAMKNESSCAKHLNFQGNTITSNGIEIDSSIIISDIIEENIVTDYIAMVALKIIIAHEIGHLLSGHIQYRQQHGENSVAFSMASTNSNVDNEILQVMEIDADQFSACHIMTDLENDLIKDEKLNSILLDQKQIYRLVGSAIQCVFYLIGIKNDFWKTDTPYKYTHPPACTRVNLFLDIMRLQMGKEREKDWAQIANGVIVAQKNIYAYYGTDYQDPLQFVIDIMGKDEYGNWLLDKWRKLKPKFAELSQLPFV